MSFVLTAGDCCVKISTMKNIYLVGFMATGKTSVGKELAKRLGKEFFDLDDLIEKSEKMSIMDIFKEKGEPYFRKVEKELVKDVSLKTDLVVGCGGGAIVNEENLSNLKKSGIVICLKADIDTIFSRAEGDGRRPLLNVEDRKVRIGDLLKKREPFYNQADHIIDTSNLDINAVVGRIVSFIEKDCK
jgi:shikimate kinase